MAQRAYTQHRFIFKPTDRLIPLYPLARSLVRFLFGPFRRRIFRSYGARRFFLSPSLSGSGSRRVEPATCVVCFFSGTSVMRACMHRCVHTFWFVPVWSGLVWFGWYACAGLVWSGLVWLGRVWFGRYACAVPVCAWLVCCLAWLGLG